MPLKRRVWDIPGGIHPEQNKQQSNQQAICAAGIPNTLIFPLSQHIGTPAKAIVKVGEKVLKGQMIAAAKGFVSVPVHASSSGEVIAIEDRLIPHPSGITAPCIVIKTDGKDEWIDLALTEHFTDEHYTDIDKPRLINIIRESGIAGMGGAGFPAAVKLASSDDQHIDTLIINGTECEPYITSDDRLMRERADEIIEGSKILRHLINPVKETIIGVEDNKPEAIAALEKAAEGTGIEIVSFPTKYPSGGEKQLIQILTGKEVPSGSLPAQVGVVCQNIGSTVAIYQAIKYGKPLISRITTITGSACSEQGNLEVLLGTPVNFLLQQCHFDSAKCSRLIMGGPMMGFTLEDENIPVVKTTNCIVALSPEEMGLQAPAQACIRCGMCEQACPVSLLPQQMYWFSRGKEYDKLEAHNIADCIECGACAYVCPSNIPLVQYYRASKAGIRQHKQDAANAQHSKARFEARQLRLEREEEEKIAKREARKAAAQARALAGSGDGKVDAVQAAIERAKAKKAAADPAQLAIEKAKSKRVNKDGAKPDRESLEKAISSIELRLEKAREKFLQAEQEGSDKLAAFRIGVEKTEEKLLTAQQQLSEFSKTENQAPANSPKPIAIPPKNDAGTDAIAKALAKREAASTMTEQEKLENAVNSLEKRVEKTGQKLAEAKEQGSDTESILAETLIKLNVKLDLAKTALKESS